jgi:hypothetical protein
VAVVAHWVSPPGRLKLSRHKWQLWHRAITEADSFANNAVRAGPCLCCASDHARMRAQHPPPDSCMPISSQAACCADRPCLPRPAHACIAIWPGRPAGRPLPGSIYDVLVVSPVHSINQAAGPGSVQTSDRSEALRRRTAGISLRRGPAGDADPAACMA